MGKILYPNLTGLYLTLQVCAKLYRTIIKLYMTVPNFTELYQTLQNCTKTLQSLQDCTKTLQYCTELYSTLQDCIKTLQKYRKTLQKTQTHDCDARNNWIMLTFHVIFRHIILCHVICLLTPYCVMLFRV